MPKNHTSRSSKSMRSIQHVKGVTVFSFPDSVWKTNTWRTRKRGSKGQKGKKFRVGASSSGKGKSSSFKMKAGKPKTVKIAKPKTEKPTEKKKEVVSKPQKSIKPKKAESKTKERSDEEFEKDFEVQKARAESRVHTKFYKVPSSSHSSKSRKKMPSKEDIEAEAYRMYMMDNRHFDNTPERHELQEEGYIRAAQANLMSTGKEKEMETIYINNLRSELEERGYTIVPMSGY